MSRFFLLLGCGFAACARELPLPQPETIHRATPTRRLEKIVAVLESMRVALKIPTAKLLHTCKLILEGVYQRLLGKISERPQRKIPAQGIYEKSPQDC